MNLEREEDRLRSLFRKYGRKRSALKNNNQRLDLMVMDFDSHMEKDGEKKGSIINIYCLDNNEKSYYLNIYGFNLYFYVKSPFDERNRMPENFTTVLNDHIFASLKIRPIVEIEEVEKESLIGYKGKDINTAHLKIVISDPSFLSRTRQVFERGFSVRGSRFEGMTYESNLPYTLRFMIDKDIGGMSWISIMPGTYTLVDPRKKKTSCIDEIEVHTDHVISNNYTIPEWSGIAPLRILSFDIECKAVKGMPKAETNEVITIGIMCKLHNKKAESFKVIFQLDECEEIIGTDLYTFKDERVLLKAFDVFMEAYDPDLLVGYNFINFDMKYLIDRKKQLMGVEDTFWSRKHGDLTNAREGKLNSKAMGFRETIFFDIPGRIQLDMMMHMLKEKKLRSFKLNSVCYEFLNEQKEDVHYTIIADLQNGDAKTRKRLASYCLQDAILPLKLAEKLKCIYNYIEIARVTGVPMNYLFSRGQQIKVQSQLYRKIKDKGLIIPNQPKGGNPGEGGYQGADVLQPKSGFYTKPIATLDFASLYPSIMISHNFCYSTLIPDGNTSQLNRDDYHLTPEGHIFVKQHIRKGILPVVLEDLLIARKKAKKELAETKKKLEELVATEDNSPETIAKMEDLSLMIGVLDSRQLAIKISANSVYGFTGAQRGALPCVQIAASVTSIGRKMIDQTKKGVMQQYNRANGYEFDADVIYGDTDSVMIKFGTDNIEEAMRLGKEAADVLSEKFLKPIKLEFEKVYYPYLLLTKKRYAGLLWTNPEKPDKKDCKGVESVRRDNCLMVQLMVDKVLDILLYEQDVEKAIQFTKGNIFDLFNNRIDLSMLVISKSLSREVTATDNGYSVRTAHAELAMRMIQRTGVKFNIGDRIPYVITSKGKNAKNYEKAEDPNYAFEHNIPLDLNYYLENQIKPPLMRIFQVLGDAESIFSGKHTLITKGQQIGSSKGIGMFFQKVKNPCISCKKPLKSIGNKVGALCDNCKPKEKSIFLKELFAHKANEREFNRLWSECQRCQGSLTSEVICSNHDCPIFFRRSKLQKDLLHSYEVYNRFN